jgi:hypothetical protein
VEARCESPSEVKELVNGTGEELLGEELDEARLVMIAFFSLE